MERKNISIRYTIFVYFTVTALAASLLITFSLYQRLSTQVGEMVQEENQSLIHQVARSVESYLLTVMKLSDSLYYGAVKNADLSSESINNEITLLYDNNKDNVDNIALFSQSGTMVEAVPAARLKSGLDVTGENWFLNALEKTENQHFSYPHVQYVFDSNENQYRWVISLSRAVELTEGTSTTQGVLLVDLSYSSLEHLFDGVTTGKGGYVYLISNDGQILYHPKIQLIDSGRMQENNLVAAGYKDGNHREDFQGETRNITVKSIGYTGWKIIGVTPKNVVSLNSIKTRLFIVFLITLILFILALINSYISSRITNPIKDLEKSVGILEEGNLQAAISIGGSYEIQHLGNSIKNMAKQIRVLMDDIVAEHEAKRKQEFDTLQSQINPHFLYNTLDIIVWMIENEQKAEAVKAVTALARFFRISLSKGKSIITVRDELEHVRNYLMIQHMRFKNKFSYEIDASEECMELSCLKLVLQPLVENAIYHGMEFMDGDGEIILKVWKEGNDLFFMVKDNGLGMTEDQVAGLFSDQVHVTSKKGSGIGVKNVNERIKLYFGEKYGLIIESEPDEGTVITICLPAVPYSSASMPEENGR
ncbi:sensor histidine kinase [Lacrimispora sphenoides]|uniref:histidine kinase n=1 Tax=Lacrimispora sphenoides JCM 1415 TaxID=1297793 RepID=A0ABY1C8P3_9FIRM|nr:sensor histidine kinase [Lacrimispora sphenoides]SET79718.1 two-component system, sensor histidine kinase YesM [[Clostridium] sphenoides JCM 1415]SUY51342.1 multi-sensor signal transduction histidine kinase [Lacrimispora sphenoides]